MARRNLEEKTALISGASRGIGQAITHKLLENRVRIIGLTRSRLKAEPLEGVQWVEVDLSDAAALDALITGGAIDFNAIDILINCAGFSDFGPVEKYPEAAIEKHFQIMLKAPISLTRAVLPRMLNRGGAIVNVSSLAVELPIPYMAVYNSAKAGLSGFSESLMLDLSDNPAVQVVDFRPGDFKTNFYEASTVSENLSRRQLVAWDAVRAKVAQGCEPERAATDLYHILSSGESGVFRTGSFFQTTVASLAARLLSRAFMRRQLLRYYGLKP